MFIIATGIIMRRVEERMRGLISRNTEPGKERESGYVGEPVIRCPRCNYTGPGKRPSFEVVDLLSFIPHVGELLKWLLRVRKKKSALLCPQCEYENPPILPPAEARKILGEYNFQMLIESQQKKSPFSHPVSPAVIVLVILVFAYILWRLVFRAI